MKTKLSFIAAVASCLVVSCDRSPSPAPQSAAPLAHDVLARVEGQTIRLADFEAELERRARGRTDAFARPEEREALLNELVKIESVYLRAKAAGFDQKPEIARQIRRFIVDRFTEEQLSDKSDLPPVSDTEIAGFYEQHAARFATPEQVRFAVIQFGFSPKATDEKKVEALHKAEAVLAETRTLPASERAFGALAQRYSEDQPTRYGGGDAGWLSRGEQGRWDSAVTDAAFALSNRGDLSPVITTANGCYLVRLMERKDAGRRPLAEVKEAIGYQLAVGKRQRTQQEFHETMKAGLKIEINRPLLESLETPAVRTEARPPSTPPG